MGDKKEKILSFDIETRRGFGSLAAASNRANKSASDLCDALSYGLQAMIFDKEEQERESLKIFGELDGQR